MISFVLNVVLLAPVASVQETWVSLPTAGAPSPRMGQASAWTGKELIVWGGQGPEGVLGDGARFDPVMHSWTPMSSTGAPTPRVFASGVWTGREFIVWGGSSDGGTGLVSGGARYDPVADAWFPVTAVGAPAGRFRHAAVWTGSVMVVWGGGGPTDLSDGGRYAPSSDTWDTVSTSGNPIGGTDVGHAWTGRHVLILGGTGGAGGLYDPVADTWTLTTNDPSTNAGSPAWTWTGRDFLLLSSDGVAPMPARYDPSSDAWADLATIEGPWEFPRAVWTGREAILVSASGGPGTHQVAYDPRLDVWRRLPPAGAPSRRVFFSMAWTGQEVLVWGGSAGDGSTAKGDGARLSPYAASPVAYAESGCGASIEGGGIGSTGLFLLAAGLVSWAVLAHRGKVWVAALLVLLPATASAQQPPVPPAPPPGAEGPTDPQQEEQEPAARPEQTPPEAAAGQESKDPELWAVRVHAGVWFNGIDFDAVSAEGVQVRMDAGAMGTVSVGLEAPLFEFMFARLMADWAQGDDVAAWTAGLDLGRRVELSRFGGALVETDLYGGILGSVVDAGNGVGDFDPGYGFRGGLTGRLVLEDAWAVELNFEYRMLTWDWAEDAVAGDSELEAGGVGVAFGLTRRF